MSLPSTADGRTGEFVTALASGSASWELTLAFWTCFAPRFLFDFGGFGHGFL
jgi:hypothetical protein